MKEGRNFHYRGDQIPNDVEKSKVDEASKILLSDTITLDRICKGNTEIAEEVVYRVTLLIINSGLRIDQFIASLPFRKKVYKNIYVNILGEKNKEPRTFLFSDDSTLNNIPEELKEDTGDSLPANDQLESEVNKILNEVKSKISDHYFWQMYIFLNGKIRKESTKETAEKLNLTEEGVRKFVSSFRKRFPKYEYFFEPLLRQDKIKSKNAEQQKNVQNNYERLRHALDVLKEKEYFSLHEKAAVLLGQWYLDSTQSKEQLKEKIVELGLSYTERNLIRLRGILEECIDYLPIDWLAIGHSRRSSQRK